MEQQGTGQSQRSLEVAQLFDRLADGYDRAALRFFPFAADRLATRLVTGSNAGGSNAQGSNGPASNDWGPDTRVLDVATGTGAVAVAVAQRLHAGGRVIGVDISEGMLDRAYANVRRMALHNVDLHPMDATALEFRAEYFNALTCSFGLFFLEDMAAALREWRRVLRPGGRLLLTGFGATAFQPLADLYCSMLAQQGGPTILPGDFSWLRLSDPDTVQALLEASGFHSVSIETEQLGFHLQSPQEWWEIIWNTGFRGYLKDFDSATLERFQQSHLDSVGRHFVDGTFQLDVTVLFISAQRD